MSEQTWTDEQLQAQLARWEALAPDERSKLHITLTAIPRPFPGLGTQYGLLYEDTKIALTYEQACQIEECFHRYAQPKIEPKHDGTVGERGRYIMRYANVPKAQRPAGAIIESKSNGMSLFLWPNEALSLLAWLEQERGTLEELAKEQSHEQ